MFPEYEKALEMLKPYVVEAGGVRIFLYPGTKDDFSDNLMNLGAEQCLIKFALKFNDVLFDLDMLYYIIDVIKTKDEGVVFYNPDSRVLDLKLILRNLQKPKQEK